MDGLSKKITAPRKAYILPLVALWTVTSKAGEGVYASSDTLFKGAIFGRDSLEVAEDLLKTKPKLVRRILLTLAKLQGEVTNQENEEEPGKIIHEYRSIVVDGKPIDDVSLRIFRQLSQKWGGNSQDMAYYGSVDSTPQFLRVLGMYCNLHGNSILKDKVIHKSGNETSLEDALKGAVFWLLEHLDHSRSGLVEYQRQNPHGLENQVWKDSVEFYVHENKQIANHHSPISSIEVQGLAYDGLKAAAMLLPERKAELLTRATTLRDRTIELLWQEDRRYFALGTDFDSGGNLRIIQTSTANPAALLDTEFFDDLPEESKQKYVLGIARKIVSTDFITDAGIRSRALSASHLINHWDYHGSFVSWPKETYDIAKGLRRQGFPELARELENRLLNVILKQQEYPEFVYVDGTGRVLTNIPTEHTHGEIIIIDAANKPERIQAWTVSAIVAIIASRLAAKVKKTPEFHQHAWQAAAEDQLLTHLSRVDRLLNPTALKARYPTYEYKLNRTKTDKPL